MRNKQVLCFFRGSSFCLLLTACTSVFQYICFVYGQFDLVSINVIKRLKELMYEKEEKKYFQICTYTGSGSTPLTLTHPVRIGKWPIVWPEFCAQSWPADAEPTVPLRLWAGHWRLGLHVLLRGKRLPASLAKVGSYGGWIRCWI